MTDYAMPDSEAQALIWRIQDATGLSDGALARACGVGRVTIWRVRTGEQSGERILPKLAQLWRIHDPDYEAASVRFHAMADTAPHEHDSHNAARARQRQERRQTVTYMQLVKGLADSLLQSRQDHTSHTPQPHTAMPAVGAVTPALTAPTSPRSFALTPARSISRAPLMVCTMCGTTVPTEQGYTGIWNNTQVYLCSRTCVDRLVQR